ncbi:MAG TPA: response regulator transcription factor [Candidatus Acidoferrales bacterium]|nr:response regulator transcription factor [Candidatus Acidoferrales bacterium]
MAIRILVADDHESARVAISQLIRVSGENWEVCYEVDNGQAAVERAADVKPDLVILDVVMPRLDGLKAGREIRALLPDVPIVIYSILASPQLESEARKVGIQAVVDKSKRGELLATIQKLLADRLPGIAEGASAR